MAIEWVKATHRGRGFKVDGIVVRQDTAKDGTVTVDVLFGQEALSRIDGDYVLFGTDGDKMYFRGTGDMGDGYKLSKPSSSGYRTLHLCGNTIMPFKAFIGSYPVNVDHANGFIYIDKTRKINWMVK